MHGAALTFLPILAAEKSKTPFYIAGGVLVAWALILSLALGLRRPGFPGNLAGERVVIAISVVLVLAAVSAAVLTAGTPAKAGSEGAALSQPASTGATAPSTPAPSTPAPAGPTAGPPPSSSPAAAPPTSALKLAANPSGALSYDTKQLSAKAGKVAIAFTNASPLEHDVTIAQGSTVLGATPVFQSGTKTVTLSLKPGTYTFYCSVPGHRQAGMEGTLSVS